MFLTKIFPKRFNISWNLLLENDKYGPTTQKLKIGQKRQKLLKHTENSLERVFMTKQQNKIFWQKNYFFTKIVPKRFKSMKTCLEMTK